MPTALLAPGPVAALDTAVAKGIRPEFYDPYAQRYPLPTYPWRWAPPGLLTIRQLRARGLRPGGQEPAAQIIWRHGRRHRVAYLYRENLALPKRTATTAQLAAISKALMARRTCLACGQVKPYYIPTSTGECLDCTPDRR